MTKFKEYLRAKGVMLNSDIAAMRSECDFETNSCAGIEWDVSPEVMDDHVVVVTYSNIAEPEYAVYDRSGACSYFDGDGYKAYIRALHCDPEYIAFMLDMDPDSSDFELAVMWHTYEDHAKVRIAFKHMKAGLMDEQTFYKLALRYRFY